MVKAKDLAAKAAEKVREPAIPYVLGGRSNAGTDCINLAGWCVQELGGKKDDVPRGSNTAWRTAMQGGWTLEEARRLGKLVPGALVYIKDAPTQQWPEGDYGHVGVYVGKQDRWPADQVIVHASASRGGVYPSTLKNAWTHAAWLKCVSFERGGQESAANGGGFMGTVRVTTSGGGLNLRQSPSTTAAKLASIPNGTTLDVIETRDGWSRVRYDGREGWVSGDFIVPVENAQGEKGGEEQGASSPQSIELIRAAIDLLNEAIRQ